MKKLATLALLLIFAYQVKSQNLISNIPANVFAVASVKNQNLFKLIPIADFDQSFIGNKFLKEISRTKNKAFESVADLGINLNETSYYFSILTDSINYNCYLMPLADATKFSDFIKTDDNLIKANNASNTFMLKDSSGVIKWDNEKVLYIDGKVNYSFLDQPENAARYGVVKLIRPYNNSYPQVEESVVEMDAADTAVVSTVEEVDGIMVDTVSVYTEEVAPPTYSPPAVVEEAGVAMVDTVSVYTEEVATPAYPPSAVLEEQDSDLTGYYERYHENETVKKQLQLTWVSKQADYILAGGFKNISSNNSYTKSINNKADASLWVSDLKSVYSNLLSGIIAYKNINVFNGFGQINLDVFLDKEKMRVESKMTLDNDIAESYRKMMDKKINRKFFKYIDSDKALGFASYAVNTKAYLREFPKLMSKTYGSLLGDKYAELADLGGDVFSVLLDEEAIAKVVKGDALFVINGVTKKKVNYTSYDYDDDYKRVEVEKTKTETLPSFLMMFSSDDYRLLTKVLNLNSTKNYVTQQNGVYKVSYRKSPTDFYVTMQKGIVFVGNNLEDFNKISQNNYSASISRKHKKMLKSSNFSFVVNPKNVSKEVPFDEISSKKEVDLLKNTLSEMNDIYIKSNRIKGNVISGEMVAEIPDGEENALQYIFSLIEKAANL